jgi:hypothetical protein
MFRRIRIYSGLFLLIVAIVMLIWGEWQFPRQKKSAPIDVVGYHLVFDIPEKIRVGDADMVHLKIVPGEPEIHPTTTLFAGIPGESQERASSLTDPVFNTMVEAQLDLDGVLFEPAGEIIMPIKAGQPLSFYWTVQPEETGVYQGVIWLHVQYVAKDNNQIIRKLISTHLIVIKSVGFWGLGGGVARLIGGLASVVGLALNFDFWIEIYSNITKKRREIIHA